jgi:hypothetical protein
MTKHMNYQKEKLKIKFEGHELIENNYSQAAQDLFVLMCLKGKRNGSFLDLGCNEPIHINNTYLLESKFGWTGISMDIDPSFVVRHKDKRTSKAIVQDATKINFDEVMKHYNSKHIDYLSLDLEPASVTLECLSSIPFDKIEFSVVTYEHDSYRFGDHCRNVSRNIFEKAGYKIIASDVCSNGCIYEDWYYNPKYVNFEDINLMTSDKADWASIVYYANL